MMPVHPETSWRPAPGEATPPLASPIATALLDAAALVPPSAVFADARRFLGLDRVTLPELSDALAGYASRHDGSVSQAGLTAALHELYEAAHRRLATRAEASAAVLQRRTAATEHLIELVDHIYSLFEGTSGSAAGGSVDFLRVRAET